MKWNRGRARALALLPALFVALCLIVSWAGFLPGVRASVAARAIAGRARGPEESAPHLVVRHWSLSKALIAPGQAVTVRVTVANAGGGTIAGVHFQAETSEGLEIVSEQLPKESDLGAGEELTGAWEVKPHRAEEYWFRFSAATGGKDEGVSARIEIPIAATRLPEPPPCMEATNPRVRETPERDFIFENRYFSAVLVKNTYGYGPILFYPNAPRGRPRQPLLAAVIAPLSQVVWQEANGQYRIANFYPDEAKRINSQPKVHLEGTTQEGDQWFRFGLDLDLSSQAWIDTDYQLRALMPADVVHFAGPMVRVGEGGEGAGEREAVFPGLEYLGVNEESSSGDYDHTPDQERLAPNPYKITVPAMTVAQDDTLVGVLWNPLQVWNGHDRMPSAVFDSPNATEGQENHLMGLFLPSIPDYVDENETIAGKPYRLEGERTLRLRAKVAVMPDERNPAEGVRLWTKAYGLPEHPKPVRSFDSERVVSRTAFTESLWHPEVPGWDFEKPGPEDESGGEEKGEPKEPGEGKDKDQARAGAGDRAHALPAHLMPAVSTARPRQVVTSLPDGGRAGAPSLPGPGDQQASARSTPGGDRAPALLSSQRGSARTPKPLTLARGGRETAKRGPGDQEKGEKGEATGEEKGEAEGPKPYQGFVIALLMDAARTGGSEGEELRKQAEAVVDALHDEGELEPRLAYRVGGVFGSWAAERDEVVDLMAAQDLLGGWDWNPEQERERGLGEPGNTNIGVCAENALPVLRFAAMTGDSAALASGVRALQYMQQFRTPAGAQTVEEHDLPLGAPDLLAAARAAECYALGYILTDRPEFLRQAEYWADTGLPFVYFWHDEKRPVMQYASVPAFGATDYDDSWIGVARQWVGLEDARALMMVTRLRPEAQGGNGRDPIYRQVADGIVVSAMRQQVTDGDLAGLIPDSWDIIDNEPSGPYRNPESLLAAMYSLEEQEMGLAYERVRVGADRIWIASPNYIESAKHSVARLTLELHAPGPQDVFTTVSQADSPPIAVRYFRNPLPLEEKEDPIGWLWNEERDAVLVHSHQKSGDNWEQVQFRHPVRTLRERRIEVPWEPKKPADIKRP